MTTDPRDRVRGAFDHAEDIDMDGVPEASPDGFDRNPPPPTDGPAPPPEYRCVGLPLNDFGNGQRFVTHFGEDLMYVPRVGWFTWTEKRWQKDPDNIEVRKRGQQIAGLIHREIRLMTHTEEDQALIDRAPELSDEFHKIDEVEVKARTPEQKKRRSELQSMLADVSAIRERLVKAKATVRSHARGTGNSPKIKALIGESETALARNVEELDADPLIVNTQSGAMRFHKDTGLADFEVLPHRRDQLLTKLMPVDFKAKAKRKKFEAFLEQIQPDLEMRLFLQRWFGLSMTGLEVQHFAFFYGGGANGKSVLVDLIARVLGDYAATAKIESLTGRNRRSGGDATPDLVPLIGARMVRASEPEEGERLQEGKIKELTGGEKILVRALQEDFVEVQPIFKLTISGNHKPEIRGDDDGIWRRVLLVPFDIQIPKADRNPLLGQELWEEREGILQWMVEGLVDYLDGGLREPDAVLAATQEYREESDPLGTFLTDCCVVTGDPADVIRTADLTNAVNYWLLERGVNAWKGTTIQRQLATKAKHWKSPVTGMRITKGKSSISQYEGLRFTEVFQRRFDDAPKDHSGRPIAPAGTRFAGSEDDDL